jgi:hypothetical protein
MPEIGAARQIQTRPLPMPDTLFPLLKKKEHTKQSTHTWNNEYNNEYQTCCSQSPRVNASEKKIIGPSSASLAFFLRKRYEIHPNF